MSCPKIRYRDRVAAEIALSGAEVKAKRSSHEARKRRETRAYRCHVCKGWHLTSEPRRSAA